jgi:hypothetical protein
LSIKAWYLPKETSTIFYAPETKTGKEAIIYHSGRITDVPEAKPTCSTIRNHWFILFRLLLIE